MSNTYFNIKYELKMINTESQIVSDSLPVTGPEAPQWGHSTAWFDMLLLHVLHKTNLSSVSDLGHMGTNIVTNIIDTKV